MEAADVLAVDVEAVGVLRRRSGRPCGAGPAVAVEMLEGVRTCRARAADVAFLRQPPGRVASFGPSERRQVVEQRVGPHVGGVTLSARDLLGERDAPLEARTRHAHILETFLDDVDDFVAAIVRLNELGMSLDVPKQRLVVLRKAKEEVDLPDLARLLLVLGAAALLVQILLLLERLAALAIQPLVLLLEQGRLAGLGGTGLVETPKQLLDGELVSRIGGPDELVVRDRKFLPGRLEGGRQLIHEFLGRFPGRRRGAHDLDAVLVGAGEEMRVVPALAVMPCQSVRQYLLVGMSEMWASVDIIDGGGDVEASWHVIPRWMRRSTEYSRAVKSEERRPGWKARMELVRGGERPRGTSRAGSWRPGTQGRIVERVGERIPVRAVGLLPAAAVPALMIRAGWHVGVGDPVLASLVV